MPRRPQKPVDVEDEEVEEDLVGEEYVDEDYDEVLEAEGESFKCRNCGKQFRLGEGDDLIRLCESCETKFDVDRIWDDYDEEKISEEELDKFDLEPYRLRGKKS